MLKIVTPINKIQKDMNQVVVDYLNGKLPKIVNVIKGDFQQIIKEALVNSPEYNELVNGKLMADLGLDMAKSRVDKVIDMWSSNFETILKPVRISGQSFSFSLSVNAIRGDFNDVLSLADATIFSIGGNVPWLEWLLTKGSQILVKDYVVKYNLSASSKRFSRTGEALMYNKPGENFKIDPAFQGTANNNWATRATDSIDDKVEDSLYKAIMSVF